MSVYLSVLIGLSDLLSSVSTSILPKTSAANLNGCRCFTRPMQSPEVSISSILSMPASLKSKFFTWCKTALNFSENSLLVDVPVRIFSPLITISVVFLLRTKTTRQERLRGMLMIKRRRSKM